MRRWWDRVASIVASVRFKLFALGRRRRLDADLEDELRLHLELRAEREGAAGRPETAARRAARLRFGSVERIREETREVSRIIWLADAVQDVRHGLRLFHRARAFAAVTMLILALGLGVNIWIFGTMNALLFQRLPGVHDPERLVTLGRTEGGTGFDLLSYPNLVSIRERNTVMSDLALYADVAVALDAQGETTRVAGQLVSANFFRVAGVEMRLGRGFTDADETTAANVVVLGRSYWERTFGSGARLHEAVVRVNRIPMQVVGVTPDDFHGLAPDVTVDVWLPLSAGTTLTARPSTLDNPLANRAAAWLSAVGRLGPRVSLPHARASLRTLGAQLAAEYPDENGRGGLEVEPLAGVVSPGARAAIRHQWTLLAALGTLVLLVVCLNVGNMLMVRAAARTPEMALRLSLGASRTRLVRQLMAESLILVAAGAGGGAFIAVWASAVVPALVPTSLLPVPLSALTADWRLGGFMALAVVLSSVFVSVGPAWAAARPGSLPRLSAGWASRVFVRSRMRSGFAVLQVGLSVALLIGALLLTRSLRNATAVDLGFSPVGMVTGYYDLDAANYSPDAGADLHQRLLEGARQWPGVESAALGAHVPLQGASLGLPIDVIADGGGAPRTQLVRLNIITPQFFRTLGTAIRHGREFTDDDRAGAPEVAVVNETCRRQCFGGVDPIGRRIKVFGEHVPRQIVGVVSDSKYSQPLEDVRPTIYVPVAQHYWPRMALLLRTPAPASAVRTLADAVHDLDPGLPLYDVRTLEDRLALALWQPRMLSAIVTGFAVLALVLAVLGVYGVVAQATDQRAPEIAVRMALGATPLTILRMVLRHGGVLVAAGGTIGIVLAAALSGLLGTFLFGVSPLDPLTFALATLLLASVAMAACVLPARRAAAASPGAVLRR